MSNLRLFILIDDSLSMAAKFGPGQAETILIGAKRLVKNFLSQTEKNPRLEILIQGNRFISVHEKPGLGSSMTHHGIQGIKGSAR